MENKKLIEFHDQYIEAYDEGENNKIHFLEHIAPHVENIKNPVESLSQVVLEDNNQDHSKKCMTQ